MKARCYHSGRQGTYSRTSPTLLDSLARSRNTDRTSSFWSSSLAVVFVPSHSDSIQRTVLVLAPAVRLSASLTPRPPGRSHEQLANLRHQPSSPDALMHDIRHVAVNAATTQDVGVLEGVPPTLVPSLWLHLLLPEASCGRWVVVGDDHHELTPFQPLMSPTYLRTYLASILNAWKSVSMSSSPIPRRTSGMVCLSYCPNVGVYEPNPSMSPLR